MLLSIVCERLLTELEVHSVCVWLGMCWHTTAPHACQQGLALLLPRRAMCVCALVNT